MNRIRTTLVKALRHGERFGHVGRDVAALVELPRAPRRQGRSMTIEEAKDLLKAARGERLEGAIACGLWIGLRPGEALGLIWADVDLDASVVTIQRALIPSATTFASVTRRHRNQFVHSSCPPNYPISSSTIEPSRPVSASSQGTLGKTST